MFISDNINEYFWMGLNDRRSEGSLQWDHRPNMVMVIVNLVQPNYTKLELLLNVATGRKPRYFFDKNVTASLQYIYLASSCRLYE